MSRSKKVFLAFAAAFFLMIAYLSYDIGSRTTFPGSKPQLKERLMKQYQQKDTTGKDSYHSTRELIVELTKRLNDSRTGTIEERDRIKRDCGAELALLHMLVSAFTYNRDRRETQLSSIRTIDL